jgi:hypothetical protein
VRKTLLILAASLLAAQSLAGSVAFVSPLEGAQAFGIGLLEVSTDVPDADRVDFQVDGVLAGVARVAPYRIAYDFGSSLSARTITATVWSAGFTKSATATVTTASLTANETIQVDLVEVPLRVRTSRTLKPSDVRVRENGVEQTVRDIRMERPPAHFAFVVDRSLSMNDGKLESALRAVQSELGQLREGDSASLVLFNHHLAQAHPIREGEDLTQFFGDVTPSGGTSLRDALASIASADRTYAIVITDGGDRNSELSDDQALQRISGTKTIVSAIVMGTSHTRFLDRATQNTGGAIVRASAGAVGTALGSLLADINSRYLLIYQSNASNAGWRSVDIRPRRSGIQIVAARKGYFAAEQ